MGITGTFEGYASSPLYLLNGTTWSNLQTTGFYTVSYYGGASAKSGYYQLTGGDGEYGWFRLNQTFDLTNYNYLKANMSPQHCCKAGTLGISKSTDAYYSYGNGWKNLTSYASGNGVVILNISSITGYYYIYTGFLASSTTGTVYGNLYSIFLSTT